MNKKHRTFCIRVADTVFEIRCFTDKTIADCRDYIVEGMKPDTVISVSKEELHREISLEANKLLPVNKLLEENVAVMYRYSDIELPIIYQKIAESMLSRNTVLIHGAAIAVNNNCYIFTAPSGTGKTTHIMNWCRTIPDTIIVNGDKPLINVKKTTVYGTPYCGKEGMNTNISVPLTGIISLERGKDNSIVPISFKEMLPIYLQQVFMPEKPELIMQTYHLIGELKDIPCYRLICNMEKESAVVAYQGLNGKI